MACLTLRMSRNMQQVPGKRFQLQWSLATALGYGSAFGVTLSMGDVRGVIFR